MLPLLRFPLTRDQLSVISALTEHGRLLAQTWAGSINGARVVKLLRHIRRQVAGKGVVGWDGASLQRCHEVKQCLADGGAIRLKRVPLPG
jgi:type IV pilus biogenesis protein CpaD/CtpE